MLFRTAIRSAIRKICIGALVGTFLLVNVFSSIRPVFAMDIIRDGTAPSFERIDRSSGLSNLSVSSIIQDKDGFIWFGTQGGLNRYDGRNFKMYTNNPYDSTGLNHNLIQTMTYDADEHIIWIGTYQGVSRFDIATDTFKHYTVEDNGLSNPVVVAIEKDADGTIWAGTLDGLNRIDPTNDTIKVYDVPNKVVRDILLDESGNLWIGSYDGLLYFDYTLDAVMHADYELPSPNVMVINTFEPGILSLGLWGGGVVKIDLSTDRVREITFADDRVYSYIKTDDGTEWIGTWGGGLFAISADGKRYHFSDKDALSSIPHPIVYSMMQDDTGILWIGTNGGGIAKVNPLRRNYVKYRNIPDDPTSLSPGKINAIEMDNLGYLWVSVYNEGLNRISRSGNITKYMANPEQDGALFHPNAIAITKSTSGDLLFASGNVVQRFDPAQSRFDTIVTFADDVLTYAIENGNNDDLWVGTYRDGIFHYDLTEMTFEQYSLGQTGDFALSDNLVYDVHMDSKGRLWVATNNGLNVMMPGERTFRTYKSVIGDRTKPATNTFRIVYEDSRGRIWIGSVGGGLAIYNEDGTFTTFLESDGMPSNVVLGVLEGTDGRIWASTHNGLAVINPDSFDIFTLTPEEGIGGYEFNAGHYKDTDGNLYFGGIHGITTIPGAISEGVSSSPRLYITGVEVYQKPLDMNKVFYNNETLMFEPDETFISFRFVALDYDSPEKTKFTYRLRGFDENWINSGSVNYVNYSKLPHGEYTFEVYAETARGVISEIESLKLVIKTPWFQSWWAYLAYIALLLTLIYGVFKIWQSHVLAQRNIELAKINSALEDANDKLEKLSTHDPLTGVYNRRYLSVRLDEELNMAIRSNINLSIIMLDLDNFKIINDSFGHLTGDQYLMKVGDKIRDSLPRSTDFVVRYGGDEFMVVLFDTNTDGALIVAEHIRKGIEEIDLMDGDTILDVQTTCSMGVLTIRPEAGMNLEMLTKKADEALYEAKKQKNKIHVSR